jgi:hypothetical protein
MWNCRESAVADKPALSELVSKAGADPLEMAGR